MKQPVVQSEFFAAIMKAVEQYANNRYEKDIVNQAAKAAALPATPAVLMAIAMIGSQDLRAPTTLRATVAVQVQLLRAWESRNEPPTA